MAFIPNIQSLRSNFSMRGDTYQNSFSSRFGGGPAFNFGSFANPFSTNMESLVKNVAQTDSKTVASKIANKIDEGESPSRFNTAAASFSRSNPTFTPPSFISPSAIEQPSATVSRSLNSPAEDDLMKNIAAATQTTGQGVFTGFDPDFFNSLVKTSVGLTSSPILSGGFDTGGGGFNSKIITPTTPQPEPAPEEPVQAQVNDTGAVLEPEPPSEPPPVAPQTTLADDPGEPVTTMPVIVKQFKDTVDDIFEEIESIDVAGERDSEEDIDSIDVEGGRKMESDCCRKVTTEVQNLAQTVEEQGEDSPWERFKALYVDLFGGDQAGALLRDFNRVERGGRPVADDSIDDSSDETIGSIDVSGSTGSVDDEEIESVDVVGVRTATTQMMPIVESTSQMTQDVLEILKAQEEKIDMMMPEEPVTRQQVVEEPPVIINNNNNVINQPIDEPRTSRVFSDDHTFNRLSFADSSHPQYAGFIMEP